MLDFIPVRAWLLMAMGSLAYLPARYVWRHIARDPSRRDITQPPEDLSWRSTSQLIRSSAILVILAAFALFIFTPSAAQFARSQNFLPLLTLGMGGWAIWTVGTALRTGTIEPIAKGFNATYERDGQPKRFWASLAWNGLLGIGCLVLTYLMFAERVGERCHDWQSSYSPQEQLAACGKLIAQHEPSDPDVAEWKAARGVVYHNLGDLRRAMIDYDEALRLDSSDSSSHYNRGLLYERRGDLNKAVQSYSDAIRLDADNGSAFENRGVIHLEAGLFSAAEADFSRAHAINPKVAGPLANRGLTYVWMNDRLRAKQDFAAARLIEPANIVVMRGEALLSMQQGDLERAVKQLSAAIEVDPKDRWSLRRRADLYEQLGNMDKSLDDRDALWRLNRAPAKETAR